MNEKVRDCSFTRVSKRRISQIVRQCTGRYDGPKIEKRTFVGEHRISLQDDLAHAFAQRPAYT
jgi:hypothetical protein